MGAICGIVDLKNNIVSKEDLRKMSKLLFHRGPHYKSEYINSGIGIAFRALNSETFFEQDILRTGDAKIFITIDGDPFISEKILENNVDKSSKPTFNYFKELYKKSGISFIERLNGPFSIALFDSSKNQLILGRDRSGQKPLYYTQSNGFFAFASELKALISLPYVGKKLDMKSLYWYMAGGYISSPGSIYKNIFKLPEGSLLIYNLNEQTKKISYYEDNSSTENFDQSSEDSLILKFDEILTRVVEEKVSGITEPIGCFLSGGVDTSLTLAFLKKVTDKKIKTFTVGFGDPNCDERPYARNIADYFGVENYNYEISENDFTDISENMIDFFDEPFADIGAATAFQAAKLSKKHLDVTFSGDGADFLFGNYDLNYLYLFYKIFPGLIRKPSIFILDFIFNTPLVKKKFPNMPIKSYLGEDTFFDSFFIKWKKSELQKLMGLKMDTKDGKFYKVFDTALGEDVSSRLLKATYMTYGIDGVHTKSERIHMANSLNVINPFLDNRVIDFANTLPPKFKYKKMYGKYLNKKVLYRYIPEKFFDRPKRGSGIPFGKLTNKGMKMLCEKYLSADRLEKEGIFKNIAVVEKAVKSYYDGDYFSGHKLWTLIIFEIWLERNSELYD